jgi:hypothetical protein
VKTPTSSSNPAHPTYFFIAKMSKGGTNIDPFTLFSGSEEKEKVDPYTLFSGSEEKEKVDPYTLFSGGSEKKHIPDLLSSLDDDEDDWIEFGSLRKNTVTGELVDENGEDVSQEHDYGGRWETRRKIYVGRDGKVYNEKGHRTVSAEVANIRYLPIRQRYMVQGDDYQTMRHYNQYNQSLFDKDSQNRYPPELIERNNMHNLIFRGRKKEHGDGKWTSLGQGLKGKGNYGGGDY